MRGSIGLIILTNNTTGDTGPMIVGVIVAVCIPIVLILGLAFIRAGQKGQNETIKGAQKGGIRLCGNCGSQNPDDATFCNRCGSNLRQIPESFAHPATSTKAESDEAESRSEATEQDNRPEVTSPSESIESKPVLGQPAGVGGWLALFCFGLTVIAPLSAVGGFLNEMQKQLAPAVVIVDAVLFFGLAVYCLVVGIRIWMVKPSAIQEAKVLLIIELVLGLMGVAIYAATTETSEVAIATGVSQFLGVTVTVAVWWLYLTRSRRVRNTFANTSLLTRRRKKGLS